MEVKKLICIFLLLFLVSFIQRPYAKIFTFDEVCESLGQKIPKNVKASEYCSQRAFTLFNVISEVSRCDCDEIDFLKSFALMIFIKAVEHDGQPLCNFAESRIVANSSDCVELKSNLNMVAQVYLFLSVIMV